jgi:serine/threonine protein kinase
MGNCSFRADNFDPTISLGRVNYKFLYVIGKGGFGKVWKVQDKKTKRFYAMKEMSKARVMAKRSVSSVMNERAIL